MLQVSFLIYSGDFKPSGIFQGPRGECVRMCVCGGERGYGCEEEYKSIEGEVEEQ